jgi:hypothetical protein
LKGEEVDTAACGAELAGRFPDVGMSGEMIAEAIVSAAGMVGMMRESEAPATAEAEEGDAPSVDDEITAAIDAELDDLVSGQAAESGAATNGTAPDAGPDKPSAGIGGLIGRGAMAAMRRAFSRG